MTDASNGAQELLVQCGEALWGPRWQTDLSEALDVSDRQVRRWISGNPIPPGVFVDLMRIMQERAQTLEDLTAQAARFGGGQ